MPFNIGPMELILVLAIALLVLGPGKLPEVGKSLGASIREFRKAATDMQESVKLEANPNPPSTAQAAPVTQAPPAAPVTQAPPAAPVTQAPPAAPVSAPEPREPDAGGPQAGA